MSLADKVFILFMIIAMILLILTIYKIFETLEFIRLTIGEDKEKETKKTHAQIKKISFRTPIQSQYDKKYKNTDGLYEPVKNKTPKRRNVNKEI